MLFLGSLLTACSSFGVNGKQYQQSQSIKPIIIPADLSSSSIESYYPTPAAKPGVTSEQVNLMPPGVN